MEHPLPHQSIRTFIHIPSPHQDPLSSLASSVFEEPLAPVGALGSRIAAQKQSEQCREGTGFRSERRAGPREKRTADISVECRGREVDESFFELKRSPGSYSRLLPQLSPSLTPSKSPAYTRRRSLPRISSISGSKPQLPNNQKMPLRRVEGQRLSFGYLNWRKLRRDPELRRSPTGRYEYVDGKSRKDRVSAPSPLPPRSLRHFPTPLLQKACLKP